MKKFFYNISVLILIAAVITSISFLKNEFPGQLEVIYAITGCFLGMFVFMIISSIVLLIGAILRKIASWFKK